MKDEEKTKEQLIIELAQLRQEVARLEKDIAERKQAEEVLRHFKLLVAHSRDIILFVQRDDGRILEANEAATKAYGYSREELLRMTIHQLRIPETLELIGDQIMEADLHGTLFETVHCRSDSSTFPVEVSSRGETIGSTRILISVVRDITERKEAEEALRISEERFRKLFEESPIGIAFLGKQREIILTNQRYRDFLGYSEAEIIERGPVGLLHPDDWEPSMALSTELRTGKIPLFHMEQRYIRKDGMVVWGDTQITVLRDKDGQLIHTIGWVQDITNRKRAEEALRGSEERYRTLSEATFEGVTLTERGILIDANAQLAGMLDYELHEIIGRPAREFMVPEDRELVQRNLDIGSELPYEYRLLRKDGSTLTVETRARHFFYKGRNVRVTALHDITERKRADEEKDRLRAQLAQAHKMEAIGTLAGGIAHDFNNILMAITGYSEIIRARFGEPALHGYLEKILASCDRAKSLVGQILTFSRPAKQERKPIHIASLIKEVLRLLRAALPSTITFRQKIAPVTYAIFADPTQIHQVLINLCTNAAHAMRERGGVLEVSLDNVEISPHTMPSNVDLSPGLYVMFTVSDTGSGIPPELMHRIFDPFFTTRMTGKGTGLGLSVVYGIVKGCGGAVTVQSELGAGSAFSVYLPAITDIAEPRMDAEEPIPGGNERILFVDDEEIIVDMCREMLEGLGYKVTAVADSRKALEIFCERPAQFDLIITDMTMPGMTGIDLSKEILELRTNIPIILCTGFNELVAEENAKRIGIREFAMKPLNLRSMAELVRKALEKKAL